MSLGRRRAQQVSEHLPEPKVERKRFEDLGIGPGGSDYCGWIHYLTIGERRFTLRSYDDEPDSISFLSSKRAPDAEDDRIRGGVPYEDPHFVAAARWLLARPPIVEVKVLTSGPSGGYEPVEPAKLG